MTAYYNEFDPYAAAWLRNLIAAGHIAPGIVDERSIEDVIPDDLKGFTQCHFFAGVGVWSLALRRAGWPDDLPIWTGSCPCQPFSSAGAGAGFDDPRHLWPAFAWLIQELRPSVVIGEQVASKAVDPWIDLVQADMEAMGYAFGAVPFPSAGVGAPHIRDRLFWVADADVHGRNESVQPLPGRQSKRTGGHCEHIGVGNTNCQGLQEHGKPGELHLRKPDRSHTGRFNLDASLVGRLADAAGVGLDQGRPGSPEAQRDGAARNYGVSAGPSAASQVNGFWSDADWLFCRDGKWRPVEPGTFPLVDGSAARVGRGRADWHTPAGPAGFGHRAGRLKGYGNAINAEAATAFIESVIEAIQ